MKGNINNRRYMAEKSKPLTEGPTKTNVKKSTGLTKAAPPPAPKPAKNAKVAVSRAINSSFDLKNYKQSRNLGSTNTKFKPQEWMPVSEAFMEATGLKGIPIGHITLLRGLSDTGKTTLLIEAIIAAQKAGKLPVIIVTEMKWSFDHAKTMGMDMDEVVDEETGEIRYEGSFIYVDRSNVDTIEDVAEFIAALLDDQKKGKLPYDLVFFWDTVGSIPCRLSVTSQKNNNEWNAGAISTQFGNYLNQEIVKSRKAEYPYTNSFVFVNKVWIQKGMVFGELPKMKNKNGETFWSDCSILVTFGGITSQGTQKIKATKDGKEVEFGKRVKVQVEKNHITGITTSTRIIATPHGFIKDDKKEIDKYKKAHSHEWAAILGTGDFDIIEEEGSDTGYSYASEPDDE